jgi:hypothetical protein
MGISVLNHIIRTYLDKLEYHLRRHVDGLYLKFPSWAFACVQILDWKKASVEYNIWLDTIVSQKTDTMHRVVYNIPGRKRVIKFIYLTKK